MIGLGPRDCLGLSEMIVGPEEHLNYSCPQPFLAPGTSLMEDNFSTDQDVQDGFGMIQAHYIYCVPYFYYYYISSTSYHQALAPRS